MREPSQYIQNIIESKSVVRPGSISPNDFENLWRNAQGLLGGMNAELSRHDADFKSMREKAAELVALVDQLSVADADLRLETPNGKRPRAYNRPEIDFAPEIEASLLRALSCVHRGETESNLRSMHTHTRNAYDLVNDAWNEFNRTKVL